LLSEPITICNIYIYNRYKRENILRKEQAESLVVGREKVWSLAYADNIVLVAKKAADLKEMLKSFSNFLKKRKLILSVKKLKMMTFKKGEGRRRKKQWLYNRIEEMDHFKYLEYTLQRNNGTDRHIKEKVRKAISAISMEYRTKKIRRRF